jgi:hypothetical protein
MQYIHSEKQGGGSNKAKISGEKSGTLQAENKVAVAPGHRSRPSARTVAPSSSRDYHHSQRPAMSDSQPPPSSMAAAFNATPARGSTTWTARWRRRRSYRCRRYGPRCRSSSPRTRAWCPSSRRSTSRAARPGWTSTRMRRPGSAIEREREMS